MAASSLQQPGCLLANLKVDSPNKTLAQRCQDLIKIIDDYHAKELHAIFSWLVESVFGSLDGILGGWKLRLLHSRCGDFAPIVDFLKPSGPMMKLVYKLQAEEYKYEVPVNYLPAPVKTSIQEGVLPDCPLFHNRPHFPMSGILTLNMALNPFEFFIFYFASCLITPKNLPGSQHVGTTDSAYFVLADMYLKYFLPIEGSVPPSPFSDSKGSVSTPAQRSANISLVGHGLHSPSLLKHHIFLQPSVNADPAAQEIWRSETLLQMLVEVWLHHYSLKMYQKLQLPQVKVLETWLSFIQPWRYAGDKRTHLPADSGRCDPDKWESFVQENLLVYTKLFQVFLNRAVRMDLVNAKNALMLFRVAKVFCQPDLADMIHKAEQLFLEPELVPHHRQPRGYLTPGQGGGFLSSRQRITTDAVFRVKSHVYALEGQDCQYKQMFGPELWAAVRRRPVAALQRRDFGPGGHPRVCQVVRLIQVVAQARHTAKRISDRSCQAAASKSLLSWLTAPSSDSSIGLCGVEAEENNECLRKTHEFLDRALVNLCTVFKLNQGQLTQLTANSTSFEDDGQSERLPDCVVGERGLVLTDLGRMQIINGLRRFDIQFQGDPELQPIRSYENALLVRFLYRMSSLLNAQFEGPLTELCSRTDFAGRLCQHYLTSPDPAVLARTPASPRFWDRKRRVGVSLRPLASYRTILLLGFAYAAGAFLSFGPVSSTLLILAAVFLHGVAVTLWAKKWKRH
ncbi:sphingomyelin phosphodiesterase 4 isoform X6 [Syngnathus typhle]|uniref:sphingomyelin phosphodiesterase 4 isoform X6 n=1 Tax=Syngnathus typhle TaxID=161592 RepID=UPI002A6A04B4|nr:sphingomyelin phosphodiesterase 4 isoform X6 [Syngnathus typhle]